MNLESSTFPSLHNRKEGKAASSIKFCAATEAGAAGVVFLLLSIGKPPRPRVSGGFAIFINRSASPPCVGARRGILRSDNSFILHRPPLQPTSCCARQAEQKHIRPAGLKTVSAFLCSRKDADRPACVFSAQPVYRS